MPLVFNDVDDLHALHCASEAHFEQDPTFAEPARELQRSEM